MQNLSKTPHKIKEITIDNPRTPGYSLKWLNVIDAGTRETNYLRQRFDFNVPHLKSSISTVFSQRPMIEDEDKYLFIILHFPVFRGDRVVAGEIEFFIGHGYLVSLHNGNLEPLNKFFSECQENPDTSISHESESSSVLLYEILERLIKDCYKILDQNSININEVEDIIFSGSQKHAVGKILELRRNIINIRKIMQNHKHILSRLQDTESSLVSREFIRTHYKNLIEHSKRIWEILENQREMVEVFNDTNESLLNDKMNIIMKTLTLFSVIVFPLTLLAAIFGMNAKYMPLVDSPYGFWNILAIMGVGSIIMLWLFYKKKWL